MILRRLVALIACVMIAGTANCRDVGPDIDPAKIVIGPARPGGHTVMSGASINLIATISNSSGAVLPGHTVSWASSDPTVARVSSGGVVTGARVGTAALVATVGSMSSAPATVSVTPGTPARLSIRIQPADGASGSALTTQPIVEVHDAEGNIAPASTTITATINTGGGTITGSTAAAVDGIAKFAALTLTGMVGDRTLTFSAPGTISVTSIGVALKHGAPARLVIRTQPFGAASGTPLTTQPVVEIRDGAGNLATSSVITVSSGIGNGGGNVTNATAAASNGLASFTTLTITGTAGDRTLTFSAPGVPTIASAPFPLAASP
jgi:hypothetical protein